MTNQNRGRLSGSDFRILRAKLGIPKGRNIRITWSVHNGAQGAGKEFSEYTINVERLKQARNTVLRQLEGLARLPNSAHAVDINGAIAEQLDELARAGWILYEAITTASDDEGKEDASHFREWYHENVQKKSTQTTRVEFIVPPDVASPALAPWGLLYSDNISGSEKNNDVRARHDCFWAVRHHVTCYPEMTQVRRTTSDTLSWYPSHFKAWVRGSMDDVLFERTMRGHLEKSVSGMKEYVRQSPDTFKVIYLCQSDRDNDPTTDDMMSPQELHTLHRDNDGRPFKGRALAILDGQPVLDRDNGNVCYKALQGSPWLGFIAAEVDLSESKALKLFGMRLLEHLIRVEGSITEAMVAARSHEEIVPWGLLFGLYCDPAQVRFKDAPPQWRDTVKQMAEWLKRI
jgi:hypothetical protein